MTMSSAVVKRKLASEKEAGDLFRQLINNKNGQRAIILSGLAECPADALAALSRGDAALGLTTRGSADVLDDVLGSIKDPEEARELMRTHLRPDRLRVLIQARGDLPAVVSELAPLKDILSAVLDDIHDDVERRESEVAEDSIQQSSMSPVRVSVDDVVSLEDLSAAEEAHAEEEEQGKEDELGIYQSPLPLLKLYAWCLKIRDRSDYDKFLRLSVGRYKVRQLLVLSVWEQAGCPQHLNEIADDDMDRVGLDLRDDTALLAEMLQNEDIRRFGAQEIETARMVLTKRRASLEKAPTMTAEEATQKSVAVGSKLGL